MIVHLNYTCQKLQALKEKGTKADEVEKKKKQRGKGRGKLTTWNRPTDLRGEGKGTERECSVNVYAQPMDTDRRGKGGGWRGQRRGE